MSPQVTIYTDGAASGNPGPGGYGVVMISGPHRKELSQGFTHTTNNRMELLAVIVAMEQLKFPNTQVTIYSDSRYVTDAINQGWLFNWERKNYAKIKNPDLWKRFIELYRKHQVRLIWIKGHNQNPENERCDKLAVEASKSHNLLKDNGFINESEN